MDEEKNYDPVTPSAKDDIRPEFLGKGGDDNDSNSGSSADKKVAANEGAAGDLRGAESAAAGSELSHNKAGLSGARSGESGRGFYSGDGGSGGGGSGSGSGGKRAIGKGPLVTAIISIFLGGGVMLGTQAFQPFSLLAQFQETFGSMHISANRRADHFFRYQMGKDKVRSPYNAFGTNFKISEKQAERLKKQGIDYDAASRTMSFDDGKGNRKTVTPDNFKELYASDLDFFNRYNAGSMTWRGQIANWFGNNTVRFLFNNRLTRNALKKYRIEYENTPDGPYKRMQALQAFLRVKTADADYDGGVAVRKVEEGTSDDVQYTYSNSTDPNSNDYEWDSEKRGKRSFDENGKPMKVEYETRTYHTEPHMVTINYYYADENGNMTDEFAYSETKQEGWDVYDDQGNWVSGPQDSREAPDPDKTYYRYTNPDGSERHYDDTAEITDKDPAVSEGEKGGRLTSEAEVKSKLTNLGGKYTGGGTAGKVANIACLGFNFLGGVSLMVYASEAMQIISLTTTTMEAFDKVKAGDGATSPINELGIALNEKKTSKYTVLDSASGSLETGDITGSYSSKESKDKSAMQSAGIAALYNEGKSMSRSLSKNDPSVQSFNFSRNMNTIFGGLGYSMDMFKGCAVAKAAAAMFDLVRTGVEVGACIAGLLGAIFTFGVSTAACGPLVAEAIGNIAAGIAIGALMAGLISVVTPIVADMMTKNLIENIGGEDFGNAITSGMNMYMGGDHRSNGGSLSTKKKYEEFAIAKAQVLADDAKYERMNKSPFDLTSKNTFMGNFMTQMMSFMTADSLMNTITTTNSVLSSSLIGMTPTATAYNLAVGLPDMDANSDDYYGNECPYLASIGAVGDAYCNPYTITDMGETDMDQDIIEIDPAIVIQKVDEASRAVNGQPAFTGGVTSDGNVIINEKSDLAKYIIYCTQRNSAFGVADQNIIDGVSNWGNIETGDTLTDGAFNGAIGSIPFAGEIIDLVDNVSALRNIGYVSGQSCVAGNDEEDPFSVKTVNENSFGEAQNTQDEDVSFKEMSETVSSDTGQAAEFPAWDKARWYQRFIEDQSLSESMGLIDTSAVATFMNDYYENNPEDVSYEGLLSKYSGLSKETIKDIVDVLAYYEYINNYDPSERYAFGAPVVDDSEKELLFEDEMTMDGMNVALEGIVYRDERYRSFAV